MDSRAKAVELAIHTLGLDADASEVFAIAGEYERYLEEMPNMLLMKDHAREDVGILHDVDLDNGFITLVDKIDDDGKAFGERQVRISESDFMADAIGQQLGRQVLGERVRVYVGSDSWNGLKVRFSNDVIKSFVDRMVWIEPA